MVDEARSEAERDGRSDFQPRGVGTSSATMSVACFLAVLFIYFGLPAVWVKPFIGSPRTERMLEFCTMPIQWLFVRVEPYKHYIQWQSDLMGLKK